MKLRIIAGLLALASASPALAQVTVPVGDTTPARTANAMVCVNPATKQQEGCGSISYAAAGVATVTSTLTSATQSASFTPLAGRPFYLTLSGSGIGSCQLERKLDGSNWATITATASGTTTQLYNWSVPGGEVYSEEVTGAQASVPWRLNCTAYTSGNIIVSFTQ